MMDRKYIPPPKISDEHVATVQRSANYVWALFEAIQKRYGEDAARKLFAPYGRALSKSDKRIRRDAALLWRLASMEKPNISRLAREIEGECGKKETGEKYLKRIGRTERHLKRIKRDPRIREYAESQSNEWLSYSVIDGKITDPFEWFAKRMDVLGYLAKNDPPDEE
jgi:hypothetical protein